MALENKITIENKTKPPIMIIGAGAAGLTAAIFAARNGAKVKILEHTAKAGKKILSTGNGKCNITNLYQGSECYRGNNSAFAMELLRQFDEKAAIVFMESIGILCKEKNGYVYPRSEQAAAVRDALLMECRRLGVNIEYEVSIKKIQKMQDNFEIVLDKKGKEIIYHSEKLIISTGSKAAPNTGSDGSGYELAKALGMKVIKPLPALVQLRCEEGICKEAAGVRCPAVVSIDINGETLATEEGELQITNYGISGIVVMQLSRFAVKALDARKQVSAVIDFFPDMDCLELEKKLRDMVKCFPEKMLQDVLAGFMNRKLAGALLKEMGVKKDFTAGKCDENYIHGVAEFLKCYRMWIVGFNSFTEAQVCQGGVATNEIDSKTMESKKNSGLYFAGEVLDIDGTCGGYNLQFAWASGAIAGVNASEV